MFWHLLPAPVIEGRVYRRPVISTDEWLDKKKLFDKTEGDRSRQPLLSPKARSIRELFLRCCWVTYVRNELDRGLPFHTNLEFSYAIAVMDVIGGWEEGNEQ